MGLNKLVPVLNDIGWQTSVLTRDYASFFPAMVGTSRPNNPVLNSKLCEFRRRIHHELPLDRRFVKVYRFFRYMQKCGDFFIRPAFGYKLKYFALSRGQFVGARLVSRVRPCISRSRLPTIGA